MPEYRVKCPDKIHVVRHGKPDRSRKLYINPEKNVAHCFVCGLSSRNAQALVVEYGIDLIDDVEWGRVEETHAAPSLKLPPEFTRDWKHAGRGYIYLKQRQLTPYTIAGYQLGYCRTGRYAGRIIIPVYEQQTLVNFQARDFTGKQVPKYTGPSKKDGAKPNALFNLARPALTGVLLLVEGPFDALRLPQYAVALLGKGWNETKRKKILAVKPKAIIIGLDNDGSAEQDIGKIKRDFTGIIPIVRQLELPAKDLGDLSDDDLLSVRALCDACAALPQHRPEGTNTHLPSSTLCS